MPHRPRAHRHTAAVAALVRDLALAGLVLLPAACKANLPKLQSTDGSIDTPCSQFADQLVAYTTGGGQMGSGGEAALGMTDGMSVPISTDDALTVAFIGLGGVVDADGDDIQVHSGATGDTSVSAYVSADGNTFLFAGTLDGTIDTIDLANSKLSLALYLQLVGQSGVLSVDSIQALKTSCPAN